MKCAGSSVEHALYYKIEGDALCTGSGYDKNNPEYLSKNNYFEYMGRVYQKFEQHTYPKLFYKKIPNPERFEDYLHITMTRNPWDALVSYYWWCIKEKDTFLKAGGEELYQECLIKDTDNSRDIKSKFQNTMTLACRYPDDKLAKDLEISDKIASRLIYFSMINSRFVNNKINCYIRYENIEDDYLKACKLIDLDSIELPRHKSETRKLDINYREYFSDWMKEEVGYYFKDYARLLNYSF